MEREKRFELSTLALARRCSTTELFPLNKLSLYKLLAIGMASHKGFEPLLPP